MTHYIYRLKRLLRARILLFWAIVFPIGLATLFKMAFGSISENDWAFKTIPVAVVVTDDAAKGGMGTNFVTFLEDMKNEDQAFFRVSNVPIAEAEQLLKDEKVTAVIDLRTEPKLLVSDSSLSATVVKTVLDGYLQGTELITKAAMEGKLEQAMAEFSKELSSVAAKEYDGGSKDPMINYFYALLAMASLYGAMFGLLNAQEVDPAQSTIAARRVAAPTKKVATVMNDVLSALTIQYLQFLILIGYFILILKVDFGEVNIWLFVAGLVHSLIGVVYGYFIGCMVRKSEGVQNAVMMGTIMTSCFLSGLMIGNMRILLELHAPIVNRINPATLMSGSLHYLCVLKDMDRFFGAIIGLLIWSVVLILGSVFFLWFYQQKDKRRQKDREEKTA